MDIFSLRYDRRTRTYLHPRRERLLACGHALMATSPTGQCCNECQWVSLVHTSSLQGLFGVLQWPPTSYCSSKRCVFGDSRHDHDTAWCSPSVQHTVRPLAAFAAESLSLIVQPQPFSRSRREALLTSVAATSPSLHLAKSP